MMTGSISDSAFGAVPMTSSSRLKTTPSSTTTAMPPSPAADGPPSGEYPIEPVSGPGGSMHLDILAACRRESAPQFTAAKMTVVAAQREGAMIRGTRSPNKVCP